MKATDITVELINARHCVLVKGEVEKTYATRGAAIAYARKLIDGLANQPVEKPAHECKGLGYCTSTVHYQGLSTSPTVIAYLGSPIKENA